jgi:hydroxymethylbilane synthase
MPQSSLRIGTRGSRLARAQAELAALALRARGIACEIVPVRTTGDRILDRPLAEAGGKGLFTKELEEALLADSIDIAVHSMKDVPAFLPAGLVVGAILPREDPADVLVASGARALAELPAGARVGTSSVRRRAQLLRARADLDCLFVRGNVDTRLAKLDSGGMEAIILALAGLKRLGLAERASAVLSPDEWLPSLGQGAVGIEIREGDAHAAAAVAPLEDASASIALACERAFQATLDGTCRTPIAGLATLDGETLSFRGEVIAPDGSEYAGTEFRIALHGDAKSQAAEAGRKAGEALRPRAARWLAL